MIEAAKQRKAIYLHIFYVPVPGFPWLHRCGPALVTTNCGIKYDFAIFYTIHETHVAKIWHAATTRVDNCPFGVLVLCSLR